MFLIPLSNLILELFNIHSKKDLIKDGDLLSMETDI